nr:FliM/FliN family flagellar motor switch protein [Hyphomonas sp. Mor2]
MRDGPKSIAKTDWLTDTGTSAAAENPDEDYKFPSARGVLSAEEIEALLRPKQGPASLVDEPELPQNIEPKAPEIFDTPETVASPELEQRAHRLAARMAIALGTGAGVKAAISPTETAELSRTELTSLLQGKSSAVACIGPSETDIRALICLPPELADAIIARACGARGSTGRLGDGWTLSAIDCALLEQLLVPIGEAVHSSYQLQAIETDAAYVSSLLPVSMVGVSEYSVEAAGLHSELAVIEGEAPTEQSDARIEYEPLTSPEVTAVLTARLASLTVPLSRITQLKAGSTLLLGLPADQPVELLSGGRDGKPAFEGRMGRKGNKVALQVTKRIGTFRE